MMRKTVLLLTYAMCIFMTACSNDKTADIPSQETEVKQEQEETETPATTKNDDSVTDSSGYFILKDGGKTIDGLTEEGRKQTVLVIPEGVTSLEGLYVCLHGSAAAEEIRFASDQDIDIGDTFSGSETVKRVILPNGLTEIPDHAFDMCESLESISIPAGVTRIGEWAFNGCSGLNEVTFEGDKCTYIGPYAFSDTGLESITLPEGLETVEEDSFSIAENLKSVTFPSTIKHIGDSAFATTGITEIHFPAGVEGFSFGNIPFGADALNITVYIVKDSWMDLNRDQWNIGLVSDTNGFKEILYEE